MDIWFSKGVQITGPSMKFTGHSHAPQRRCSDSYWPFGPVMNNLLLDQTNFYWTLPHVRQTIGMTGISAIFRMTYSLLTEYNTVIRYTMAISDDIFCIKKI